MGRSSRTYQTWGLWDAVLADAARGDFVLIQMGQVDVSHIKPDRFSQAARQVAEQEGGALIDLFAIVMSHYARRPPAELKTLYVGPEDVTHTSPDRAKLNADCVVERLRGLESCPLAD